MATKKFKPTKDMWYNHFHFYKNDEKEIRKFKKELKTLYPNILGFVDQKNYLSQINFINCHRVLAYFSSKEESLAIVNGETSNLYKKYVGENIVKG